MRFWSFFSQTLLWLLVLLIGYQGWIAAHIFWWKYHPPQETAVMRQRMQEHSGDGNFQQLYIWKDAHQISPQLKRAVIAAEDAKFIKHDGFDWAGIEWAMKKNLKQGRIVAGGSTISQQLAKNLFLSTHRTPWRKLEEALITLMLENILGKKRILEIYLNVIEWGNGIFGAEAAAHHYFKRSASRLSQEQAAKLAAMIPNPRHYDEHRASPELRKKTRTIMARMPSSELP